MNAAVAPVRAWRLHLGAHKTATTHLQSLLTAMRDDCVARGIDPIPYPALKPLKLHRPSPWDWRSWLGGRALGAAVTRALAPLRRGPDIVILSNEDLLGWTDEALAASPYPRAESRLRAVRAVTDGAEVALFLAVRGWDALLPSAYAQLLRHGPVPGGFAALATRVMQETPAWSDLATRLTALFPDTTLTVWRQEDYRANAAVILEAVVGAPLGPLPAIAPPARTRAPSAAAIAAAEALDPGLPADAWRRRVAALFADDPADGAAYAPIDAATRAALQARYAEDLAQLAALPRVRLLRFD